MGNLVSRQSQDSFRSRLVSSIISWTRPGGYGGWRRIFSRAARAFFREALASRAVCATRRIRVKPASVTALRGAIAEADAVLISTPEYNSSIPGALKNALDWASRPIATNVFRNKPVAVVGSSTGMFGAVWAQAELRKVLAAMGARVAEVEVTVGHAADKFDDDGNLLDENVRVELADAISTLLAELDSVLVAA